MTELHSAMKTNNLNHGSNNLTRSLGISATKWQHSVVYRIDVASFADSDDDNKGDLHGLIDRLDYIASLGVDAIQIVGWTDLGREISKRETDNYIGQLVIAAKARGLRLLPDFNKEAGYKIYSLARIHRPAVLASTLTKIINSPERSVVLMDDDKNRLLHHYGSPGHNRRKARLMATILATLPVTLCLYQGQELGLPYSIPMPWDYDEDSELYSLSVSVQDDDELSTLNYYRQVIAVRKSSLILQDGAGQVAKDRRGVLAYLRCVGQEGLLTVANLTDRPLRPKTPLVGQIVLASQLDRTNLDDTELQPYEAVVLRV